MPGKATKETLRLGQANGDSTLCKFKTVMETAQKRIKQMNRDIQEMDFDARDIKEFLEDSGWRQQLF
jgi:hypothetical protein